MTAKKDKPVARKTAGRKLPAIATLETTAAGAPVASLVERIYDELEDRIVSLELPPGAMLSEVTIAREFGVSRTPVGEALQRLAREGLVNVLPRRGIVVTDISLTGQMRVLEFRRDIANFIARLGATRADASERDALRRVAKAFLEAAASADGPRINEADKEFHELFATCAHNNYAAMAMAPLDSLARRFFYAHSMDIGRSAQLHADIAVAMADGDPVAAERATHALADYLDELTLSTLDKPRALAPRSSHIFRPLAAPLASTSAETPVHVGS